MAKGLFVTGTGTDVGKTYVTALMVKKLHELGLSAGYYKAAMSGNVRDPQGDLVPGDAQHVKNISGIPQSIDQMCPYVYEAAVSPHLASRLEGNPVKLSTVVEGFREVCAAHDYVTMEGSGGILCPLEMDTEELWLPDVIKACGLGCIMVADAGLGTINAVALTACYLRQQGIALRGILFNNWIPGDTMQEDNRRMCEYLTGVPVLACVKQGDTDLDIDPAVLTELYQ